MLRAVAEREAAMEAADTAPVMSTVQMAQLKAVISEARPCLHAGWLGPFNAVMLPLGAASGACRRLFDTCAGCKHS